MGRETFEVYPSGADDTTRLQAVLDAASAAGNADVLAGPGDYVLDGDVRPRLTGGGVRIVGAGAEATRFLCSTVHDGTAGTDVDLFIVGQGEGDEISDVTVEGISFEFTGPNSARGGGACLRSSRVHNLTVAHCATRYGSLGMNINRAHGFWIHHNGVSDSYADGINCNNGSDGTAGMTVRDGEVWANRIRRTGDDAIAVGGKHGPNRSRPSNVAIFGNDIADLSGGGGVGIYGIDGCQVYDNRIVDPGSHFMSVLVDTQYDQYPSTNVDIHDNDCRSDQTPAAGRVCMWIGGRNTAPSGNELDEPLAANVKVTGNRFVVNDRSGIWCQPHHTMPAAQWLDQVEISGNTVRFVGTAPAQGYRGLHLQKVRGLTVEGNRISGFPHMGALVNEFTDLRFVRNDIAECVAHGDYAGQNMVTVGNAGTATDTIVDWSGNLLRKTSGSAARLLYLRAAGSGSYPRSGDRLFSAGATITVAEATVV